jgi:hypothetical protein
VTEMEYRLKLDPDKRVIAIQPIPGKQSTDP